MATPVILNNTRLELDPASRLLKAEDYALYLQSQEIIQSAQQQAKNIVDEAKKCLRTREKTRLSRWPG